MDPVDLDTLDPATQKLALDTLQLRSINEKMIGEIEQLGGGVDMSGARIEHLLLALVEQGVLTQFNMWTINKDWELTARPQIKELRGQMLQVSAERQRQASAVAAPSLILPPGARR